MNKIIEIEIDWKRNWITFCRIEGDRVYIKTSTAITRLARCDKFRLSKYKVRYTQFTSTYSFY
jgi:hypothetical protein